MFVIKKILCPIDFSEPSYHVLRKATELAFGTNCEFTLLHVLAPYSCPGLLATSTESPKPESDEAYNNLEQMIVDFMPRQTKVSALVLQGDVTSEIIRAAIDENSDLIVMATHGASGWREFVLGSVTDEIIRLAPCPVLTLNEKALERPGLNSRPPGRDHRLDTSRLMGEKAKINFQETPREADFPFDGSPQTKLRFLLNYAILAPSNRNSQPWLWRFNSDAVDLYADRMRALPNLDPIDRELILSCGAALFHLRLAIRYFGYTPQVEISPDTHTPDLLARIRLGEESPPQQEELLLFKGVLQRHTNRQPFLDKDIPASLINDLQLEALREKAALFVIENAASRAELIDLVAKADLSQGLDSGFLWETSKWMHPSSDVHADGIQEDSLKNLPAHYDQEFAAVQADRDRLLAWSAPVLAVLETTDDTPSAWLAAGQALARLLLRASVDGVQANFLNSPVEVGKIWPQLHHLLGHASFPQMILRLGYPSQQAPATPRRPVSQVVQ